MADTVDLKKLYSKLNESLIKLNDESGVHRTLTVPYVDGQAMSDHINAVSQAVAQSGGMTNNILSTSHHSTGKGWGSGDGHTVAHPVQKLRETNIPKGDENAKAVIDAASAYLNAAGKLLGADDQTVKQSKGQLEFVKKTDGQGMTLLDFNIFMTGITAAPTQAVARAHSGSKDGGHHPLRRPPAEEAQGGQETPAEAPGQPQGGGEAPTAQAAAPATPAQPESQPAQAPAAPQAA